MSKKILIIDDEKDFCFLLKKNVELSGDYKVITATGKNLSLWMSKCRFHKPQVILLDISMPCMDGFQVLRILKKDCLTANIPVIILTARSDVRSEIRAEGLHCDGYFIKPVDLSNLLAKIDEILAKPDPQSELKKFINITCKFIKIGVQFKYERKFIN